MVTVRFIFLAICFLLSVLQSSHARDDTRVLSRVVSKENSAGLCSKMFVGVMCAPGLLGTEAEYCAAGDIAKYLSYQKTLNYIIEFAIEHGITGAYNRKFAYAGSGYDRGFNLKKPETTQYRTMNPNGAKKADGKTKDQRTATHKERKIDTQLDQNTWWKKAKQSGEWEHESGHSKPTLWNSRKKCFAQKSKEKWEIEVYDKNEHHIGVIKPSDGEFHPELAVNGRKMEK